MILGPRAVWQIAAGQSSRTGADVFTQHGVALLAPGDAGPWSTDRPDEDFDGAFVRRFATEVRSGDAILLRVGSTTIRAVGVIASEYQYLDIFDDVNGMDMQHARRARWGELPEDYDFVEPVFGGPPRRFGQVAQETVLDFAQRFLNSPPISWQEAMLPPLPAEEPALGDQQLPERIRVIVAQARDLQQLYSDGQRFGLHPTEDEMIAHFIVPLLLSLGWRPELIGVKWRNIDVALFGSLPRTPESCRIVFEAKRLGVGAEGALAQAIGYVQDLGLRADVVVTDGFRYRRYARETGFAPSAYANHVRLKRQALALFTGMSCV
ncbi:MAG: hypothetical protein A2139_06475 [Desulfobacca sp. RBG_16_60_12]|nr:MAG: hypothetical protein A2139_06475 [Desulfobacca sp. RBG_16_60_12]